MVTERYNRLILLSSPGLDYKQLATCARHEFGHQLDYSSRQPFAMRHNEELTEILARDRQTLEEVQRFMRNIISGVLSPKENIERLKTLAVKRGLIKETLGKEDLPRVCKQMLNDISTIEHIVSGTFMPPKGRRARKYYNANLTQRFEVPAVLQELEGSFGRDFIYELLSRISQLERRHRAANPMLRDNPGNGIANFLG